MSEWSYVDQPGVRHIGPMAQDFRAAFGVGASDRAIAVVDANGVTMAALQALVRRVEQLDARVDTLQRENAALRRDLARRGAHIHRRRGS